MNNILSEIIDSKKIEVKKIKTQKTIKSFEDYELFSLPTLSFIKNIEANSGLNLIAEIKKGSPSKGIIRKSFDPIVIAGNYIKGGADAISILTDEHYFHGSLNYLGEIAKIKNLPLLRKDFIIDEIQVYEAKAYGADIVLLICEVLHKEEIRELTSCAYSLGLEVLLEMHSLDQISKIDFDLNKLIGVNNRDLRTFNTSIQTSIDVSAQLPNDVHFISESGINGKSDIDKLKSLPNCKGVLVGEYFMRRQNIFYSTKEFKNWCANEG